MNRIISFFTALVLTLLNFLNITFEAPDLKPLESKEISMSEQDIELLKSVFDSETEWLASLQLDNGAIPMTHCENGEVRMNPYFADFAALALLDNAEEYASRVKEYAEWHFEHLNTAQTDYNGVDGTIYDYIITVSGGKVIGEEIALAGGIKTYDSTDSYAATFLSVLNKYYAATGDGEYILSRGDDIKRVADAMLSTMHNGLTFAKPDYEVKYLMDNCEVYEGAAAAAELFESVLNDYPDYAEKCRKASAEVKSGIERNFRNHFGGYYKPAINKNGLAVTKFSWDEYYPCATAQLFPIICGVIEPNTERANLLYGKFCDTYKWEIFDYPDVFCWGSNVYAAVLMNDVERTVRYMTEYTKKFSSREYPLYNADSARVAMAAHMMLEKAL